MRQRYSLKWTSGNESLQSLERFFNDGLNYDTMLQRIREMVQKLPIQMANIIKFDCLTGLRPAETVEAVKLILMTRDPLQNTIILSKWLCSITNFLYFLEQQRRLTYHLLLTKY
jgi:hypothetical protein